MNATKERFRAPILWFGGKRQIAVILRINRDGSLFYNVMNADDKRIDDFRVGELLYGR